MEHRDRSFAGKGGRRVSAVLVRIRVRFGLNYGEIRV